MARRGVSSIVGSIFFIMIMLVSISALVSIFNSFTSYNGAVGGASAANLQNQQTTLTFPSFQFGSPGTPVTVPAALTPALDGSAGGTTATTSVTSGTFTTTGTSDVLIVNTGTNLNTVTVSSVVSSPALTWTHRTSVSQGTVVNEEEWYTATTSTFSGTVTVTWSAGGTNTFVVFGISGAATGNCGSGGTTCFDANAALPATNGNAGVNPVTATISTSTANDFLFGLSVVDHSSANSCRTYTQGTGFTLILSETSAGAGTCNSQNEEYEAVSSTQSSLAVQFTLNSVGGTTTWTEIGDAVVASTGTTTSDATDLTSQRKLLYSSGLWWDFFSSGTNIVCVTSSDGLTWSSTTTIVTGSSSVGGSHGYDFSVWLGGASTLYYAIAPNGGVGNTQFNWRYGTLSSSGCGSISWTIAQTQITTTNVAQGPLSIETDAGGNTWVALTTLSGATYHLEVWHHASGALAGTWVKEDDIAGGTVETKGIILPYPCGVAAGCAVLAYGTAFETGATSIISSTCTPTCATWSAAITTTSDYLIGSSSAVVIGNTLYFAGLGSSSTGQSTGTLNFWSFPIGGASTPPETTIESTMSDWDAALSSSTTTLVLFEETSGTTIEYRTSVTFGATWYPLLTSGPISISTTETSAAGISAAYSGTFAATWTAGASSPFSIRFASLSMLSVVDSSVFAVHLIGSYVYQPNTNTLIAHYDIISSGSGVAPNGLFDFWVGAGSQMDIPLPFNTFNWVVTTAYLVTVSSDGGIVVSETLTSPA